MKLLQYLCFSVVTLLPTVTSKSSQLIGMLTSVHICEYMWVQYNYSQ